MEYNFSDLCVPQNEGSMPSEFVMLSTEAEYDVRNTVLVDGGDRFGVSAVVFDKYEELIWMGNQGGHVTSYHGAKMQKYTSFQVHQSEEIRDILTMDAGIYVLTKSTLRHQIRRGLPKWTFKSENMHDMQCLYQVSDTQLLMGGHQDKLVSLDLSKMEETIIPITEEGCAVMRHGGGSLVACGSAAGVVTLRDIRCPGTAELTFRAHTACLSDFDLQGEILISCGFTQSGSVAVAEPYVVAWDLRNLRKGLSSEQSAWSVNTISPPLLLQYLPVYSGTAIAVSGDGQVTVLHVKTPEDTHSQSTFQVDVQDSACSVIDVSMTNQALVFGDQGGHLHLFSPKQNNEPVFNNFSRATQFATPAPDLPKVKMTNTDFQFSSVPLPQLMSGSKWFNELPEEFYKRVYRKPKPVDPEILKTMKMQGPIGYAPNPKTFRRNQMPYVEHKPEDANGMKLNDSKHNPHTIPKYYQKVDLNFAKQGSSEETDSLNKTGYPGLESTVPNSYCNPMLQVLYYLPPVKEVLLAHTCAKEFCLSCELGFLFRTLDRSGGEACQASNFLRAFRTVPEAAALGLILPDTPADAKLDLAALIQSWNRFILHQMHYEILETQIKDKELTNITQKNNSPTKNARLQNHKSYRGVRTQVNGVCGDEYHFTQLEYLGPSEFYNHNGEAVTDGWAQLNTDNEEEISLVNKKALGLSSRQRGVNEESAISRLFSIGRHQLNKCSKCNKEEERESAVLACALPGGGGAGFAGAVRAALAARRHTPAWCDACRRFTPTLQRGRVHRLPPILSINCGGMSPQEKACWSKEPQAEMIEIKRGANNGKPCRYGLHCVRSGCRFKHPERSGQMAPRSPVPEPRCTLPQRLRLSLQPDGDVVVSEQTEERPESPSKDTREPSAPCNAEEQYRLSAAVLCIEDSPRHLVAYIRPPRTTEPYWYLFNDLSIMAVSAEEVLEFGAWWKSPCVLVYAREVLPPAPLAPPPAVS